MENIRVKCYRYNKSTDEKAYYKFYDVPVEKNNPMSVYNILEYIYDNIDPSLAFFSHSACKQVACGRCIVKVNDTVVLACKHEVNDSIVLIEPVNKNKVIKDLVCV